MTHKQEQKVFLSRLVKPKNFELEIHQGRGRCLVDESVLQRPINQRPVCSVYRVVAKYLSMPGVYVSAAFPIFATDDAKKRTERALTERFVIRGITLDGELFSRDMRIQVFLELLEKKFCILHHRVELERSISHRLDAVLAVLSQNKTFKGFGLERRWPVFFDAHNLIRCITPDELVYGVGGNPLRLTVHAMSMLRESIILDMLLSRRILLRSIRDIVLLADNFAREELKRGDTISCRQCKQGKELAIPGNHGGGIFYWRNREVHFNLEDVSLPDPLTGCPTRGMRSRYESDQRSDWPDTAPPLEKVPEKK